MDRAKFEKAKEIDEEICKCNDILKRLASCDSVAFREGDKINGCAYKYTSTTGALFAAMFSATEQYIIDRRAQLEDEFEKL